MRHAARTHRRPGDRIARLPQSQTAPPSDTRLNYFAGILNPAPTRADTWYVIRGQSFLEGDNLAPGVLWDMTTVPSTWKDPDIGFRCVKDAR